MSESDLAGTKKRTTAFRLLAYSLTLAAPCVVISVASIMELRWSGCGCLANRASCAARPPMCRRDEHTRVSKPIVGFLTAISASPGSPSSERHPWHKSPAYPPAQKANGKGPGLTWTSGTVLGPILPSIRSRIFCAFRDTVIERFSFSAFLRVGLHALPFYRWPGRFRVVAKSTHK